MCSNISHFSVFFIFIFWLKHELVYNQNTFCVSLSTVLLQFSLPSNRRWSAKHVHFKIQWKYLSLVRFPVFSEFRQQGASRCMFMATLVLMVFPGNLFQLFPCWRITDASEHRARPRPRREGRSLRSFRLCTRVGASPPS